MALPLFSEYCYINPHDIHSIYAVKGIELKNTGEKDIFTPMHQTAKEHHLRVDRMDTFEFPARGPPLHH